MTRKKTTLPNHDLRRNSHNEPVCACGFRPEILDQWCSTADWKVKAKTAVLDHAKALNAFDASVDELVQAPPIPAAISYAEDVLGMSLTPWQKELLQRLPESPFVVTERTRYPRAGVRLAEPGKWKLTLWDEPDVIHAWADEADAFHSDRYTACATGELIIGVHRQSGTDLNGLGK